MDAHFSNPVHKPGQHNVSMILLFMNCGLGQLGSPVLQQLLLLLLSKAQVALESIVFIKNISNFWRGKKSSKFWQWSHQTNMFLTKTLLIDIYTITHTNLDQPNKVIFAAVILSIHVSRKLSVLPEMFEEICTFNG